MASTYINRAFTSAGNQKIWTLSGWFKRSLKSGTDYIFCYAQTVGGGSSNRGYISFNGTGSSNQNLRLGFNPTGSSWTEYDVQEGSTIMDLRDTHGWYHVVIAVDTTQATATNRIKVYINGVQRDLSGSPSQNFDTGFNANGYTHEFGSYPAGRANGYYDGSMSHLHFIDGTQYQASDFGETDSTTGEWKIKTEPSVTYGTNGFFILKDGNSVTDQSGQGNNFTVGGGTLTKTEDCPSNVFNTLNPLSTDSGVTLSSGNTESDYDGSVGNAKGTLGFSSGKFYWEAKIVATTGSYPMIGIGSLDEEQMQKPTGGSYPGGFTNSYGGYGNGSIYANGSNTGSQSFTWGANDIIGIAVDLDSGTKTIKWFKNGSQIATYNITTVAPFTSMDYNGAESAVNIQYNFGNGYFGTTAVSSAGVNASGNGIFEYDVPTGYTALSTKGLNL